MAGGPFEVLSSPVRIKDPDRAAPVTGPEIRPVTARASSETETAGRLTDHSGLLPGLRPGLPGHDAAPETQWLGPAGPQAALEFEFDRPRTIETMAIWNYNERWRTRQGLRSLDVSVWRDGAWHRVRDDLALEEAEGTDRYDDPLFVRIDPVNTQKVRFDDLKGLDDTGQIGLGEVRFFEPRGPCASGPWPMDGAEGVQTRDLVLTWTAGLDAVSHRVYLGRDPNRREEAGKVDARTWTFKIDKLVRGTRYAWRVDEVRADGSVVPGPVWGFVTGRLIAWWPLDGDAEDRAGDAPGTCVNMDPVQWVEGRHGRALRFDGTDDYVDLGPAPSLQREVLTFTAWILADRDGPSGWQSLLSFESRSQLIGLYSDGHPHYAIQNVTSAVRGQDDLRTGKWTFVAVTRDLDNRVRLYVDGKPAGSGTCDLYSTFHRRARLGGDTGDNEYFKGLMDDVRIYDYPLAGAEIEGLSRK